VSDSNPCLRETSSGGAAVKANSVTLPTPAAIRISPLPFIVRRPSPPGRSRRRLPHGSGPCVLRTPEDWPLSLRSVAGLLAAYRTPFHDTNAAEGITTVSRPVPGGADVFPLFL